MNKNLLLICLVVSSFSFSQMSKGVLFLGNSYTGVNNLPSIVAAVAASAGDNLTYDSNTPGGYTFEGHLANSTSIGLIGQPIWDFVVLQEQSQLPSFPLSQVQSDCFPFANSLDSLIRLANPCTETMFYMTWGRENGDAGNCASWPPVCTYEGMDDLLRERYNQMAVDNEAVLSPVGAVWRYLRQNNPTLQLYASDGSHPSLEGSYAAACTFYSSIFKKDPTLITDDYGLTPFDAQIIRNAAKAVVFDSLLTWHVGEYEPLASFTSTSSGLTQTFTNTSSFGVTYFWDFGDGTTSTDLNPVHTYSTNEPRLVCLTVNNCGAESLVCDSIMTDNSTASLKQLDFKNMQLSPNPVVDILNISVENTMNISLVDEIGRKIPVSIVSKPKGYSIDLTSVKQGVYFVIVEKEGTRLIGRIFKE